MQRAQPCLLETYIFLEDRAVPQVVSTRFSDESSKGKKETFSLRTIKKEAIRILI